MIRTARILFFISLLCVFGYERVTYKEGNFTAVYAVGSQSTSSGQIDSGEMMRRTKVTEYMDLAVQRVTFFSTQIASMSATVGKPSKQLTTDLSKLRGQTQLLQTRYIAFQQVVTTNSNSLFLTKASEVYDSLKQVLSTEKQVIGPLKTLQMATPSAGVSK